MVWWMKYQVFAPLALLQALNLFRYFLIWRIAARYVLQPTVVQSTSEVNKRTFIRAVTDVAVSDVRSDDEDDGSDDADDDKED